MPFAEFAMERWQSLWEHTVEINLSDSGVHPLALRELCAPAELEALGDLPLGYAQTNGTRELRALVAALHPGATPDHVEIVNGGAEASFLALWRLVEPGDEVVVQTPIYGQVPGLARALGATVKPWRMRPDLERGRWEADLGLLAELVTPRTKLVALCTPGNPTGRRLTEGELEEISAVSSRAGAWLLCDEVYRGSELDGALAPSAWGRGERVIVTGSLSKTQGLPGLRLGWLVAPPALTAELWARHDYTTIAPGTLSDAAARVALRPAVHERLRARARRILRENLALAGERLAAHGLRLLRPEAGAMLWVAYDRPLASSELAERLRAERSVLVVPGDHFDVDPPAGGGGWLRIGYGGEPGPLGAGLDRLGALLGALPVA